MRMRICIEGEVFTISIKSNKDIEVDIKDRNEIRDNMELNVVHMYINNKNNSTTLIA